jgi:hypothetical protein
VLVALIVLVLTAVFAPMAFGQAAEQSFRFTDEAAVPLGPTAVPVTLVNDSGTSYTVTIQASFDTGDDGSKSITVPVNRSTASLGPGDSVTFTVGPIDPNVASGSGSVVAIGTPVPSSTADTSGPVVVARRPLTVATTTTTALGPAVTSWSATRILNSSDEPESKIPLSGPCPTTSSTTTTAPAASSTTTTAAAPVTTSTSSTVYLVAGTQNVAVPYACTTNSVTGKGAISVDITKITEVGAYAGSLKVGDTAVSLSVTSSRAWWIAIIAILLGVVVAAAQQAWTNNWRPMKRAEVRANMIGLDAIEHQKAFTNESGAPYRLYDYTAGVANAVDGIQREIDSLRPGLVLRWLPFVPTSKDDQDEVFKGIVASMTDLDATVQAWPQLLDDLKALSSAVRLLTPVEAACAPKVVDAANLLLDPTRGTANTVPVDLARARELITTVPQTTIAIGLLPKCVALNAKFEELPMPPIESSDWDVYELARRERSLAAGELADATSAADLQKADVDSVLTSLRKHMLELEHWTDEIMDAEAAEPQRVLAAVAPNPGLGITVLDFFASARNTLSSRLNSGSEVRAVDLTWLFIAIAIAAWTGIAANYTGKAWGTIPDFVVLFVWALGATSVLTTVLTGLSNVVAGPIRLQKKGADDDTPSSTIAPASEATRGAATPSS